MANHELPIRRRREAEASDPETSKKGLILMIGLVAGGAAIASLSCSV